MRIITPSTGATPVLAAQYDVDILLVASASQNAILTSSTISIIESELVHPGIQALIGRDILKECLFVYDGKAATFTIAI